MPSPAQQNNLFLYLHTHWDREWYYSFEFFRAQLLRVVETIIEQLENDKLPTFMLDGQASVLDDATELKPSLKASLANLIRTGKLEAGPWYVSADQWLVCGESLIRNLKYGIEVTKRFGEPTMVGYCPDNFGHTADLPRILKGMNIDVAVIWRGVPGQIGAPLFHWQSPDGTGVIAYQLGKGYYATDFHDKSDTQELSNFLANFTAPPKDQKSYTWSSLLNGSLVPIGGDHMAPPENFMAKLHAVINAQPKNVDAIHLEVISLGSFCKKLVDLSKSIAASFQGELRANDATTEFLRSFIFPDILSTRLHLKLDNQLAERRLIRSTEPLFGLLDAQGLAKYPREELDYAWKLLLQNHPHDSICGCSIDPVHREMKTRTSKFNELLSSLERQIVESLNGYNVRLSAVAPPPQVYDQRPLWTVEPAQASTNFLVANPGANEISLVLPFAYSQPIPNSTRTVYAGEGNPQIEPLKGAQKRLDFKTLAENGIVQISDTIQQTAIFGGQGKEPYVDDIEVTRGWIFVPKLKPFSLTKFDFNTASAPRQPCHYKSITNGAQLANDLVSVTISLDGSIELFNKSTNSKRKVLFKLVDTGDAGDSYTYDPVFEDRAITATLSSIEPGKQGPLITSVILEHEIAIPDSVHFLKEEIVEGLAKSARSASTIAHKIRTEIYVKLGSSLLHFYTSWQNDSADHRLEAIFELPEPFSKTFSENHFSLIERGLHPPTTLPVPKTKESAPERFPSQRFLIGADFVFVHAGLPEYGFTEKTISITLLRAVSRLSRSRLMMRGNGAGPGVEIPDANCLGACTAFFAFGCLSSSEPPHDQATEAYQLAENFENIQTLIPLSKNASPLSSTAKGSLLSFSNAAIRPVAIYKEGENLVMRLLNVTMKNQTTAVETLLHCDSIIKTNLAGDPELIVPLVATAQNGAFPRQGTIEFKANELVTLQIRPH